MAAAGVPRVSGDGVREGGDDAKDDGNDVGMAVMVLGDWSWRPWGLPAQI
jgi:hypothetical protein